MAINLATKYSAQIAGRYAVKSVIKGRTANTFDFAGARTVRIYTPQTVALENYTRSGTSRYGTPTDIGDTVQEMIMSQDKSFTGVIDLGDASDQMNVKKAGQWLKQEMDEVVTPAVDRYALDRFVKNAGKIASLTQEPDKDYDADGILQTIASGVLYLNQRGVPRDSRYLFIGETQHMNLALSQKYVDIERLGEKTMEKGVVGTFMGLGVVPVPDGYLPSGCSFLIARKDALLLPWKLHEVKIHTDPPGINGSLIEGRFYYDAFVVGAKADGVYAAVLSSSLVSAPTISCTTPGTSTMTLSCSGASSIKYTIDGTDPRYSASALVYSSAVPTTDWTGNVTVKAAAYSAAGFVSDVTEQAFTIQ